MWKCCDRYQDDGHLGSLRSPLRADTERMVRYRGLRHADHPRSVPSERRRRGADQSHAGPVTEQSSDTWQLDRYQQFFVVK